MLTLGDRDYSVIGKKTFEIDQSTVEGKQCEGSGCVRYKQKGLGEALQDDM